MTFCVHPGGCNTRRPPYSLRPPPPTGAYGPYGPCRSSTAPTITSLAPAAGERRDFPCHHSSNTPPPRSGRPPRTEQQGLQSRRDGLWFLRPLPGMAVELQDSGRRHRPSNGAHPPTKRGPEPGGVCVPVGGGDDETSRPGVGSGNPRQPRIQPSCIRPALESGLSLDGEKKELRLDGVNRRWPQEGGRRRRPGTGTR